MWAIYRGKKGSCFKFPRAPSHMKQNVALSILTPFSSKSATKVPPKKLNWMTRGVCYIMNPFFTSVYMYVFQAEESILHGFEKIGLHFPKKCCLMP